VSFSIYGERGIIDIVAWHASSRSLLIIELKTTLVDPRELVGTMDKRVRLGKQIGVGREWHARTVSSWVVVADTRTNHCRLREHNGLLRGAFPADGHAINAWLRNPAGSSAALSFWPNVGGSAITGTACQRRRVRKPRVADD
jgi:hypothetical protein